MRKSEKESGIRTEETAMKSRICFIIGVLANTGGTERVCTMIANALSDRYDVTILSTWHMGEPPFDIEESVHVDYLMEPWEGKIYHLFPQYFDWKYRKYLQREKFDLCIDVDICLAEHSVPALKNTRTKLVEWEQFNYLHSANNPTLKVSQSLAMSHCSRLVVLTQQDHDLYHVQGGVPESKLVQIYNASPLIGAQPSPRNSKLAIAVGRLTEQKGFDLLLRAWSQIEKQSDWRLAIIGSGRDEQSLKKLAQELQLSRVDFVPNTPDIESWYDKASVFLLPSRYEGFGMVLLEAMAKGLPAVSFDVVAGPRELIDDGNTGFLVSLEAGPDGFAEKTLQLFKHKELQDTFSINALKKVSRFRIESIRQQWVNMLDEVIAE